MVFLVANQDSGSTFQLSPTKQRIDNNGSFRDRNRQHSGKQSNANTY
jgi:hypothetical protein